MSSDDAFWLNIWEWTATIGFVLVIVGVVIEGVEHFKKFTKKEHARKLHIEKVGWLILVAGLALEFFAEHAAKRISDRENARLNTEAGKAIKQAAESNERSKQLEATNLVLRAELLKQERRTRPRFLGFDRNAFNEALKGRPAMRVEILYPKDDVESYELAALVQSGFAGHQAWYPMQLRAAEESDSLEPKFDGLSRPIILRAGAPMWGGFGYVVSSQLLSEMRDSKTGMINTNNAAGALLHAVGMAQKNDSLAIGGFSISAPAAFPTNLIRVVIGSHYIGPN